MRSPITTAFAIGALGLSLLAPVGLTSAAHASPADLVRAGATADTAAPSLTLDTTTYQLGQRIQLSGTTDKNTFVSIYDDRGAPLGGQRADDTGNWTTQTITVPDGTDPVTITVIAGLGDNTTELTRTLTAKPTEPTPLTVSTTDITKGQKQLIEGTAPAGARVDVYSGSKYLMHVTADRNGNWSYTTGAVITDATFTRIVTTAGQDPVTFTLTAE